MVEGSEMEMDFHFKTLEATLKHFGVDPTVGLNAQKVRENQTIYGKNQLGGDSGNSIWKVFASNVFNAMNLILGIALGVSIYIGDLVKILVLLFVILTNSGIGFFQEFKSEKTMEALRNMSSPNAQVTRDGEKMEIPASEVTIGDIVSLDTGDIIPADMRLLVAVNLETDEAFLTGESMPIPKHTRPIEHKEKSAIPVGDRKNCVYMNSTVSKGRGEGVVFAISFKTEVGKIAKMVGDDSGSEKTPLIRSLNNMMYACAIIALVLGVIVFAVNKFHFSEEIFLYAISVGIAILPEGLPAVITVALAIGMHRMSEQKALVRKLAAIEAVGQVTNVCSDKTGTLTEGKMVLKEAWIAGSCYKISGKGTEPIGEMNEIREDGTTRRITENDVAKENPLDIALEIGCLCSTSSIKFDKEANKWISFGDPTEVALIVFAAKMNYEKKEIIKSRELNFITEFPFESATKRMTSIYKTKSNSYNFYVKGAMERILPLCSFIQEDDKITPMTEKKHEDVQKQMELFASRGMRVLALAFKSLQSYSESLTREEAESGLTLIGLVAIYDPPRVETAPAVAVCHTAGIVVHMATGDHAKTAEAIAREVGILKTSDLPGAPLVLAATDFDAMTNEEIDALVELPRVLARCSPETKVKLIHALHRRGKFVAMTGDGVNDAPAVKKADIGIAMGIAGSDVTKQASEITLTDDNFATITLAIREGRRLFVNATNIAQHLLSGNVSEVIVLVVGLAITDISGLPVFPMSAIQILWLNMITSSPVALALGVEEAAKDIMKHPPRAKNASFWTPMLILDTGFYGIVLGVFSLISFTVYMEVTDGLDSIPVDCGKKYTGSHCDNLYAGRAIAFYVLSVLLLVHGLNCRHSRFGLWQMKNQNKHLWGAVLFGLIATLPTAFIPGVNIDIFDQMPFKGIWWLVIFIEAIVFILISELYKFGKRVFLRRRSISIPDVLNSEEMHSHSGNNKMNNGGTK